MTPQEVFDTWRGLLAQGFKIEWPREWDGCVCWIWEPDDSRRHVGHDADPLLAFEAAYRAYRKAKEQKP